MSKYAVEFFFEVLDNGNIEFNSPTLIGDLAYLQEAADFEYDYWNWFKDKDCNPDWKDFKVGTYHVFAYGNVSEEWSDNWEYGREFEGFIFEPEYTRIKEVDSGF